MFVHPLNVGGVLLFGDGGGVDRQCSVVRKVFLHGQRTKKRGGRSNGQQGNHLPLGAVRDFGDAGFAADVREEAGRTDMRSISP